MIRRIALVPTNQQRREAERRRLQRQLEERRSREIARRRMTLIGSIVATLVVIAAVVIVVVATTGSDKKTPAAGSTAGHDTITSPPSTSAPATTPAAAPAPTAPCAAAPKGATASFKGLTVTGAKDLKHEPKVSGKSSTVPSGLLCQDLVVGTGAVAKTTAQATVEYVGVLYKTGAVFQSSWTSQPATFSLATGPQGVITGFSQGIAGAGKVAPMRVGGRRILILPSALAYGPQAQQGIPANSVLVFVVDLQKITG
jgi:FKBP-type peptidyl-prolyl cis-trans isomerase